MTLSSNGKVIGRPVVVGPDLRAEHKLFYNRAYMKRLREEHPEQIKAIKAKWRALPENRAKESAYERERTRLHGRKNRIGKGVQMTATRLMTIAEKNRPCADCGVRYPYYVMDFDHVRGEKLFNINKSYGKKRELVRAELTKCDVVCSNCHRHRTYSRIKQAQETAS